MIVYGQLKEENLAVVTMKNLLESGVHFGHQTKRWDPRMKRFIFAERNGIHIIDLQKTIKAIKEAFEAVRKNVLANKAILFVGTKKQAGSAVEREAKRCGMYYVNNRWLGGMLTNFYTIKKSILRLKKIEKMEIDGTFENMTKKEVALLLKEKGRLDRNLGGIKEMKDLPGILFIIDTRKEAIAVEEAKKMDIPIVAVVDTNCNPDGIDYPIPGNDDAIRAITLFTQIIANAVIEAENEAGLEVIETLQEDDEKAPLTEGADNFDKIIDKDEYDYKEKDKEDESEVEAQPKKTKKKAEITDTESVKEEEKKKASPPKPKKTKKTEKAKKTEETTSTKAETKAKTTESTKKTKKTTSTKAKSKITDDSKENKKETKGGDKSK
jgi:small subunit ribosomal protein S2